MFEGDLYEYILAKIATAGQNAPFAGALDTEATAKDCNGPAHRPAAGQALCRLLRSHFGRPYGFK